jgi:hypothetical protein
MRQQGNVNRLWIALLLTVAAAPVRAADHQSPWLESLAQPLTSPAIPTEIGIPSITAALQFTPPPRVDSVAPPSVVLTPAVDAAGVGALAALPGSYTAPAQSMAGFGSTVGNFASVVPSEVDRAAGLATPSTDNILVTPLLLRDASSTASASSFVVPANYFNNRQPKFHQ